MLFVNEILHFLHRIVIIIQVERKYCFVFLTVVEKINTLQGNRLYFK